MTSHSETGLEGQVDATNPIEIFWEKNKRSVLIGVAVVLALLGGNAAYRSYQRSQTDATWSRFASATGLDDAYGEPLGADQFAAIMRSFALFEETEISQQERDDLTSISSGSGPDAPWALWMLALDARTVGNYSEALRLLDQIQQRFPEHLLATEMPHPPQWLAQKPSFDDEGNEQAPSEVPVDEREYVDPMSGSPVSMLREQVENQREFETRLADLTELPAADSAKLVVFRFEHDGGSLGGEIKVRLYQSKAPQNVAAFQTLASSGYFEGLAIHTLRVTPGRPGALDQGSFDFGWPSSVEESTDEWVPPSDDDVEERAGEDAKDALRVDWESTGVMTLPFVLSVRIDNEGKTRLHDVSITAREEMGPQSANRLVIGQVVEGQDLVRRIVEEAGFLDANSETSGQGKPAERVRIASVQIVDA